MKQGVVMLVSTPILSYFKSHKFMRSVPKYYLVCVSDDVVYLSYLLTHVTSFNFWRNWCLCSIYYDILLFCFSPFTSSVFLLNKLVKLSSVCVPLAGKLGHGDTNRVYKPKVVEALQGMFIRKVCAGSQSSLALTSTGQVGPHSCYNTNIVFRANSCYYLPKQKVVSSSFWKSLKKSTHWNYSYEVTFIC